VVPAKVSLFVDELVGWALLYRRFNHFTWILCWPIRLSYELFNSI